MRINTRHSDGFKSRTRTAVIILLLATALCLLCTPALTYAAESDDTSPQPWLDDSKNLGFNDGPTAWLKSDEDVVRMQPMNSCWHNGDDNRCADGFAFDCITLKSARPGELLSVHIGGHDVDSIKVKVLPGGLEQTITSPYEPNSGRSTRLNSRLAVFHTPLTQAIIEVAVKKPQGKGAGSVGGTASFQACVIPNTNADLLRPKLQPVIPRLAGMPWHGVGDDTELPFSQPPSMWIATSLQTEQLASTSGCWGNGCFDGSPSSCSSIREREQVNRSLVFGRPGDVAQLHVSDHGYDTVTASYQRDDAPSEQVSAQASRVNANVAYVVIPTSEAMLKIHLTRQSRFPFTDPRNISGGEASYSVCVVPTGPPSTTDHLITFPELATTIATREQAEKIFRASFKNIPLYKGGTAQCHLGTAPDVSKYLIWRCTAEVISTFPRTYGALRINHEVYSSVGAQNIFEARGLLATNLE